MNKMKKALLGTALAGAVVVGASAGTYAWFNAEYTNSGTVTNHTLEINNGYSVDETLQFDGLLAPSRTVSTTFKIENTGSMDQILRGKFDLVLKDADGVTTTLSKDQYSLTADVKLYRPGLGDITIPVGPATADVIDYFNNMWIPDADGLEQVYFQPGDAVKVNLHVTLNENADNKYQGAKLEGNLEIDGRQTDSGSKFND